MDEQTTIVGRPTYMAMFAGLQEPGPILDALTGAGYPRDDVSILLRPAGTDSVLDLLSHDNAAGQDSDVRALIEKQRDKLKDANTVVILHPEPAQVEAVRAALTGMGAEECDYNAETRYTGADSEADFERSTIGSVGTSNNKGLEGASAPAPGDATKPGQFHPSPANATEAAGPAPSALSGAASGAGTSQATTPTAATGTGTGKAGAGSTKAEAAEPAANAPAAVDNSDLKAQIARLEEGVVQVKRELQQQQRDE